MHRRNNLLSMAVILALVSAFSATINATEMERWRLPETRVDGGEYLVYRLSYRGIFTAFVWKELADLALIAGQRPINFEQQPGCHLQLKLSTENYAVAEVLRPTRYQRHSIVDPGLQRALLVEEIEDSTEDEQNATWINWTDKRIELFRQRRQTTDDAGFFFDDDDPYPADIEWEEDGAKPLPDFLNTWPLLDGKYTPLIYDKSIDISDLESLLDPLSLIFAARWQTDDASQYRVFPVTYEDEVRYYRTHTLGREDVDIAGARLPAHKLEIKRTRLEGAEDKGFLIMWLSDDERRIPLQFEIQTKVGKIKIHIRPESLRNNRSNIEDCIATGSPQLASKNALSGAQYQQNLGDWVGGVSGGHVTASADPITERADLNSWSIGGELRRGRFAFGTAYVWRGDSNLRTKNYDQEETNIGISWRGSWRGKKWRAALSRSHTTSSLRNYKLLE